MDHQQAATELSILYGIEYREAVLRYNTHFLRQR